jgi:hypothetical protein
MLPSLANNSKFVSIFLKIYFEQKFKFLQRHYVRDWLFKIEESSEKKTLFFSHGQKKTVNLFIVITR